MLTTYPAIFCKEEDGRYSVLFPDLHCATCGDNLNDAMEMAVDCMAGIVHTMQEEKKPLPGASEMTKERLKQECAEVEADPTRAFWNLIAVDVEAYAKQHFMKSVKKTLTIPAWLNDAAERHGGVNYSGLLQKALKEYLGIE